jgi:hypothetical protein
MDAVEPPQRLRLVLANVEIRHPLRESVDDAVQPDECRKLLC